MTCHKMSQKKIFLVLIVICTVSLLLHHGGHLNWNMEVFHPGCATLPSHPAPGLKPKQTNIVFLKTHKTASTTMQNLLFRFAERHNLTVALPVQACGHQFCYPRSFASQLIHPHTLPANIITNHMRFNQAELKRLMPNDTIYITILREPASMFESLFSYYSHHCQSFKRVPNGSLEAFLKEPFRYYRPEENESVYARNTLTFDLGGNKDRPATDMAYAKAFAEEVERVFSLVMISEYFDESLVLLRHLFSWDLDDIIYIKLNMRTSSSKRSLTPDLDAKIRSWNSIDAYLYDHFNATLWRKLSALGLDCVTREVQLLHQAKEKLMRTCFGNQMPIYRSAAEIKNKDLRPWQPSEKVDIVGYDLPGNISHEAQALCRKYILPEVSYTQMLFNSQSLRHRRIFQKQTTQKSHSLQPPIHTILPRHSQVYRSQLPSTDAVGTPPRKGSTSTQKPATDNKMFKPRFTNTKA